MKKIITSLASAALCLSLVACSQTSKTETSEVSDSVAGLNVFNSAELNAKKEVEEKKESGTSELTDEVKEVLYSLDTDYSKVYWGVEYSIFQDTPGLVASISMYNDGFSNYLVVGITNLYNTSVQFSSDIGAYNKKGDIIGNSYIFENALGSGNTSIYTIYCGSETPDGRVNWKNASLEESSSSATYVPWQMDYSASAGNDVINISYEIYSANKEDLPSCTPTFIVLDKDGYILALDMDYIADTVPAGKTLKEEATVYIDDDLISSVKQLAVFANPSAYK